MYGRVSVLGRAHALPCSGVFSCSVCLLAWYVLLVFVLLKDSLLWSSQPASGRGHLLSNARHHSSILAAAKNASRNARSVDPPTVVVAYEYMSCSFVVWSRSYLTYACGSTSCRTVEILLDSFPLLFRSLLSSFVRSLDIIHPAEAPADARHPRQVLQVDGR